MYSIINHNKIKQNILMDKYVKYIKKQNSLIQKFNIKGMEPIDSSKQEKITAII